MKRFLRYTALAALLLTFFGLYSNKVWDVDFWWHLAFGKAILAAGTVPDSDPFGVYASAGPRSITIMKCYWLTQVLMYAVVSKIGIDGIIVLKALLLTASLLLLVLRADMADSHPAATYLVAGLSALTLQGFTGERPQLMSFFFVALLFFFLDRYRLKNERYWLYPVPLVMLLWANSHGGVVMGSVLLVAFAGLLTAEQARSASPVDRRELAPLLGILLFSLLMTLVSPAGWNTYLTVVQLEGSEFQRRISEYLSPWQVARQTSNIAPYYYGGILLLSVPAVLALLREREVLRPCMVLLLAAFSLSAYRYVPFFLLATAPYTAAGLTHLASRRLPRPVTAYAAVIAACTAALTVGMSSGAMFQRGVNEQRFPVGSVRLINDLGISGKLLSSFEWGGYLLWHAYPGVRIYIDGRILDMNVFNRYTHMIWATPEGMQFFEQEAFDSVLLPRANAFTGEEYALNHRLRTDPRWRLVNDDAQALFFVRRPGHQ